MSSLERVARKLARNGVDGPRYSELLGTILKGESFTVIGSDVARLQEILAALAAPAKPKVASKEGEQT